MSPAERADRADRVLLALAVAAFVMAYMGWI